MHTRVSDCVVETLISLGNSMDLLLFEYEEFNPPLNIIEPLEGFGWMKLADETHLRDTDYVNLDTSESTIFTA